MDIYLLIEGQQSGPYSEEQVRQSLTEGFISNDLHAWREGLTDWVPVEQLVWATETYVSDRESVPISQAVLPAEAEHVMEPVPIRSKKNVYRCVAIAVGIVIAMILLGVSIGIGVGLTNSKKVSPAILETKLSPPREPTSTQPAPPVPESLISQGDSANQTAVKIDDAKQQIIEDIERSAGFKQDMPHENCHFRETYDEVFFDEDTVLYEEIASFSDSDTPVRSKHTFDLGNIEPGSFLPSFNDYSDTDRLTGNPHSPEILYDISCKQADDPNEIRYFMISFADKAIAQDVADALNYISMHVKPSDSSLSTASKATSEPIYGGESDEMLFRYFKALAMKDQVVVSDETIREIVGENKAKAALLKKSLRPGEYQREETRGEAEIESVLGTNNVPVDSQHP